MDFNKSVLVRMMKGIFKVNFEKVIKVFEISAKIKVVLFIDTDSHTRKHSNYCYSDWT